LSEQKYQQFSNAFYAQSESEVLTELEATSSGLNSDQVNERVSKYGPNKLDDG